MLLQLQALVTLVPTALQLQQQLTMTKTALLFMCIYVAHAYQTLDINLIRANAKNIKPMKLPRKKLANLAKQGIKLKKSSEENEDEDEDSTVSEYYNDVHKGDVNDEMFKPMGKLLFQDDNKEYNIHWCSAQYVAPNLLLTAAHCVYTLNKEWSETGWFHNYTFIQNYHAADPDNPKKFTGTLRRVEKALIDKKYYTNTTTGVTYNDGYENMAYDFAFISMYDPTISTYHEMGLSDSYSKWTAAGYPKNYANGQQLHYLNGIKGQTTSGVFGIIKDPMQSGCSGGAWLAKKADRIRVVGINSYTEEKQTEMFSPRFLADVVLPVRQRAIDVLEKLKLQQAGKCRKCADKGEYD